MIMEVTAQRENLCGECNVSINILLERAAAIFSSHYTEQLW
jgi:hypothetical protein